MSVRSAIPFYGSLLLILCLTACFGSQNRKGVIEVAKPFWIRTILELREKDSFEPGELEGNAKVDRQQLLGHFRRRVTAIEGLVKAGLEKEGFSVGAEAEGSDEIRILYREASRSWFSKRDVRDDVELQLWRPGHRRQTLWITTRLTIDQMTAEGLEEASADLVAKLLRKIARPAPSFDSVQ